MEGRSGLGSSLTRHSALFKMLQPPIALHSAHTVLLICLVKQVKCLCKIFTKFAAKFHTHTHTHTHTRCSSSSFIVTLSLIRQTACACAQFSQCSSMTNAHSEMGQMAVCCQNLPLGALSSHSTPSMLVGALFIKFGLFLNTPHILVIILHNNIMEAHFGAATHAGKYSAAVSIAFSAHTQKQRTQMITLNIDSFHHIQ